MRASWLPQPTFAFPAIVACFYCAASIAFAQRCGEFDLDPTAYADIRSDRELRQRIGADVSKYRDSGGAVSMECFARHYTMLGDRQPYGTNSWIRLGESALHEPLYNFDLLVWEKQNGNDMKTSVAYGARLAFADGALVFVDDEGAPIQTLFEEAAAEPRICPASPFDPRDFANVRGKREIGQLLEQSIRALMETKGEIDWLCLAEDFMDMDDRISGSVSVDLILEEPRPKGVYRFTVRNVKLVDRLIVAPGGSNGEFAAIVRVEAPDRIAIVERGGNYRWLDAR